MAQMVAANEVPESVVADGMVGALQTLPSKKEENSCSRSWSSQVSSPG